MDGYVVAEKLLGGEEDLILLRAGPHADYRGHASDGQDAIPDIPIAQGPEVEG